MKPCSGCVKNNCYDDENPHSSRRSALCPGHIMSTANYIEENVGRGYRRFGRKTGLESCIILAQEEKDTFLRIIRETVEDYGEIAIKSQLFASFYIRHCLSNNLEISLIRMQIFLENISIPCFKNTIVYFLHVTLFYVQIEMYMLPVPP